MCRVSTVSNFLQESKRGAKNLTRVKSSQNGLIWRPLGVKKRVSTLSDSTHLYPTIKIVLSLGQVFNWLCCQGSGWGTVGSAVVDNIRDLRFESQRRQKYITLRLFVIRQFDNSVLGVTNRQLGKPEYKKSEWPWFNLQKQFWASASDQVDTRTL